MTYVYLAQHGSVANESDTVSVGPQGGVFHFKKHASALA
jgi:hypothetical protein